MFARPAFCLAAAVCSVAAAQAPTIRTLRVPDSGLQPQSVVAPDGTLHLLYYKGGPAAGDLYYVTRAPGKSAFSAPIRVNSQPGSAIALGNDRGGQLALGKAGRIHVAWNGSSKAQPKGPKNPAFSAESSNNGVPMLYSRLNDRGDAFEPQRNLITSAFGLDGGGSVAADTRGRVYIVFHADPAGASGKSETERRVFVAGSDDDGATFAPETPVSEPRLGTCGCCGLKAFTDAQGALWILFRSAEGGQNRDMMLQSTGHVPDLAYTPATTLDRWRTPTCPMTTPSSACNAATTAYAWETDGNVFFAEQPSLTWRASRVPAPGDNRTRKYPSLAIDAQGRVLLAWTEGMTWGHEGTAHWQLFSAKEKPIDGASGQAGPIPAWSLVAAIAEPDGSFTLLY